MADEGWLRAIAEEAAGVGSRIVAEAFGRKRLPGERKGAGDYVTDVDRTSEEAIREHLADATPDIPVLAEEGGGSAGERGHIGRGSRRQGHRLVRRARLPGG